MKSILFIFLILSFLGCDGKINQSIQDKGVIGQTIVSMEIIANNKDSLVLSKKIIQSKGFIVGKSDYTLRVEYRNYATLCTNPLSRTSSDYTYEGLLVLELFYKGSKVYSIFRDIKKDVSEKHYVTLIEIMLDDLKLKKN